MGWVLADAREWYLMGTPVTLYLVAIHFLGASPSLRGTQHDHGPTRPASLATRTSLFLNASNLKYAVFKRACHFLVHQIDIVALDEMRFPAVTLEQVLQLFIGNPCEKRRVVDLVAVQIKDRQDGAISNGI